MDKYDDAYDKNEEFKIKYVPLKLVRNLIRSLGTPDAEIELDNIEDLHGVNMVVYKANITVRDDEIKGMLSSNNDYTERLSDYINHYKQYALGNFAKYAKLTESRYEIFPRCRDFHYEVMVGEIPKYFQKECASEIDLLKGVKDGYEQFCDEKGD